MQIVNVKNQGLIIILVPPIICLHTMHLSFLIYDKKQEQNVHILKNLMNELEGPNMSYFKIYYSIDFTYLSSSYSQTSFHPTDKSFHCAPVTEERASPLLSRHRRSSSNVSQQRIHRGSPESRDTPDSLV